MTGVNVLDLSLNAGTNNGSYKIGSTRILGSFGAMTGSITGSQPVQIKDCTVKNTAKSSLTSMQGDGFGGGMIGVIGTSNNDSQTTATAKITISSSAGMTGSMIQNLNLKSMKENAGGLVGHVFKGKLVISGDSTEHPVMVSDSAVTSYWNAGGLVGEIRSSAEVFTISNAAALEAEVQSYKCSGGIVGENGKKGTITKVNVKDSTITERSTTSGSQYTEETGQGGIVGNNKGELTISDASVGISADGKVCLIQSARNPRNGGSKANGVGGIVGYVKTSALTLANCLVKEVQIHADGNATNENNSLYLGAGGIVGYADKNIILTPGSYIHAEKSKIWVGDEAADYGPGGRIEKNAKYMAAGGCFGYLGTDSKISAPSGSSDGLSAADNAVKGKQAGGIIGVAECEIRVQGRKDPFQTGIPGGATVSGGTVYGMYAAGGLIGEKLGGSGASMATNPMSESDAGAESVPVVWLRDVTISGKYSGGVIGRANLSADVRLERMEITGCKIYGNTLVSGSTSGGAAVGGVIGYFRTASDQKWLKLYHFTLDNNKILYESGSETLNDKEHETENANTSSHIGVGGLVGRAAEESNKGSIYADHVILKENNTVGVMAEGTTAVKLIDQDNKLADVANTAASGKTAAQAAAELTEKYGYYVGTLVGTNCSSKINIYMMRIGNTEDSYEPVVLGGDNPPVTDVGRLSGADADAYRANSHIIYGTMSSAQEDGKPNVEKMDAAVQGSLASPLTGSESLQAVIPVYRLPSEVTIKEASGSDPAVIKAVTDIWKEAYSLKGSVSGGAEQTLPVLVCKPGLMTLDAQIKLFSDIMTNVSGISASNMQILSIGQKAVTWNLANGTKTKTDVDESSAHVLISGETSHDYSFSYNNSGTDNYDSYTGTKLQYTELTFTYQSGSDYRKRIFVLPLYIEEPLIVDVQAKMLSGRVSSVDEMAGGIDTTATIANDSDYTLLLDFSYGNARSSYDLAMEKQIYLTNTQGVKKFEEGTKLLLIDVSNGNKPYYYTVPASPPEKISFSDFTDTGLPKGTEGTTAYEEKRIDRTQNADGSAYDGHDKYMLQVLPVTRDENSIYDIHVGFRDVNDENKTEKSIVGTTEKVIKAVAIPGLKFELVEKGNKTKVVGSITEGGILNVDMEFKVTMNPEYKNKENPMDSANNEKYLDLSCYLTDEDGRRIPLPDGTNIEYTDAGGNLVTKLITDYASVYYYKDVVEEEYKIRGTGGKVLDTVQVPLQIKLKLPEDLSALTEDTYKVHIDLLRSDDAAHPSGYEDALDIYEHLLGASVIPKLGFAVTVDEEDWKKLGVNLYNYDSEFAPALLDENGSTQIHEIPFKVQIDFRNILKQISGDDITEKWSAYDYYVTYQVFGKQADGTYPMIIFTDGTSPKTMRIAAKGGKDQDGNENVFAGDTAVPDGTYTVSSGGELRIRYALTKEEIKANEDKPLQKGKPIEREGKVVLNMDQLKGLTSKEDFEKYLTNYMMKATLRITDGAYDASAVADDVSDFFVYTVTKLKADME